MEGSLKKQVISVVKTLIFMSLATTVMILLMSLLFYKAQIGDKGIGIGVIITYFVTTFIGGFVFGKVNEKRKYLYGLLIGAVYFTILIICSMIFLEGSGIFGNRLIISLASCMIGGMAGGMISN